MKVERSTHAIRQIRKLPDSVRADINAAIRSLENWPHVDKIKRLQGRDDYRLRVGNYRVFFEITSGTIWITQVLIRNENTY